MSLYWDIPPPNTRTWVDNFIHHFNYFSTILFPFNKCTSAPSEGRIKQADSSSIEEHNWSPHPLLNSVRTLSALTGLNFSDQLPWNQPSPYPPDLCSLTGLPRWIPGSCHHLVSTPVSLLLSLDGPGPDSCPLLCLGSWQMLSQALGSAEPSWWGHCCVGVTLGPWLILPWEQPHCHCSLTNRTKVYWTYSKVSSG